jgi:hypothetical protein
VSVGDKAPAPEFLEGQQVDLQIDSRTNLGYKALINGTFWGLLYQNEVFQKLEKGQRVSGFIKKVREDGKVDLCLQKPGTEKVDDVSQKIISRLQAKGGFMAVTDKTRPELIYSLFGVSKKTFKKAVGALYKRRIITIEETGIRLVAEK